ncbi:MAG: energy transducer TonB [candidate division Zixibacteria bacterium]|nr:energy transducer TonB [candidate division Zixibacteria bacterium]
MDCRNFEIRLWEHPHRHRDIDRLPLDLSEHIDSCGKCRQLYQQYLNVADLASKSEIVKTEGYWQKFEDNVWDKIEQIENAPGLESDSVDKPVLRGTRTSMTLEHLFTSISVAVTAVVLMFMAVSDITQRTDHPIPRVGGEKAHNMIGNMPSPHSQALPPSINVLLNRSLDGKFDLGQYSILPQPETKVVSDETLTTIESAFLTDEGLEDKNIEVNKANINGIVIKTEKVDHSFAKMQALTEEAKPSEWIISVEKMPKMIKAVPPDYPMGAFGMNTGGEVWIKAYIDARGKVEYAEIYDSSGTNFGFEEAALEAAKKNEFEPFEIDGENHPIWVIYKVSFVAKE